ncbi:hypothetical protein D9M69_679180 [compost metagenome]
MVIVPVIFVITKNEYGFLPDLRVLGEDIQHFRNIPCSIPGSTGVIREILRGHQPGNGRKFSGFHVFPELIKYITLRYGHLFT